jgi:hypothetical protein
MDDGTFPDYRSVRSDGIELTQEKNNLYVASSSIFSTTLDKSTYPS